jgi:uncharacterized protein
VARSWAGMTAGALFCLLVSGPPAGAATESTKHSIDAMRERINAGTVGIVAGGLGGTYIRIAAELASVLDNGDTLRVLPLVGKGSVQNIADILFLKGIDVGIVQSDVLAYIKRERLYPGAEKSIQYIAKLYNEEVHVLAGKGIAQIGDLAGKKVNFDGRNSGTAMTASLVLGRLKTEVEPVYDDQALALDKLRRGEIAALVYVTGKPASLFRDIKPEEGLHFLALPLDAGLLDTYLPSQLGHGDYPALVPEGAAVDTVAVGAVMAVYNWAPRTDRYAKVARFVDAFFEKFPALLEPSRHPKWKEVNLAAEVPDWTRFPAADEWLKRSVSVTSGSDPLARDFMTFIDQSGRSMTKASLADREALFREFLRWQQNRAPGKQAEPPPSAAPPRPQPAAIPSPAAPSGGTPPAPQTPVVVPPPANAEPGAGASAATSTQLAALAMPISRNALRAEEPEMVMLTGGTFAMGSGEDPSEKPIHYVTIAPFAISKYPITMRQWRECVAARACVFDPSGDDNLPMTNVSWADAQQFTRWLSQATGKPYRLPSEAEWEYAARGNTETKFWWGNHIAVRMANCLGCGEPYDAHQPLKVGSFVPNSFGLYDMGGGVAQWVADCYHKDYRGAPPDGSAWLDGDCSAHILRGGSWRNDPSYVRPASRDKYDASVRYPTHGFRVVYAQ